MVALSVPTYDSAPYKMAFIVYWQLEYGKGRKLGQI
jgi:hypothetical protein